MGNEESLGFSMKAALKGRAAVGKKGVFGTTADRFHGSFLMTSKDEKPDPTKYDHKSVANRSMRLNRCSNRRSQGSSQLKSRKRFMQQCWVKRRPLVLPI